MSRQNLTTRGIIKLILAVQFIPLLLLPPESLTSDPQQWWLPAMLTILTVVAALQLLLRGGTADWAWKLVAFSQGFNIISRLLLVWPHAAANNGGVITLNVSYLLLAVISILCSAFMLWYLELPEVRMRLAED